VRPETSGCVAILFSNAKCAWIRHANTHSCPDAWPSTSETQRPIGDGRWAACTMAFFDKNHKAPAEHPSVPTARDGAKRRHRCASERHPEKRRLGRFATAAVPNAVPVIHHSCWRSPCALTAVSVTLVNPRRPRRCGLAYCMALSRPTMPVLPWPLSRRFWDVGLAVSAGKPLLPGMCTVLQALG
jgi:hypothetical protein